MIVRLFLIFNVIAVHSLLGCISMGDTAFKIRGVLMDESQSPYDDCVVSTKQGQNTLAQSKIHGIFDTSIVFHPTVSSKPLKLEFKCTGASEVFAFDLDKLPKSFEEYIEVGSVIVR